MDTWFPTFRRWLDYGPFKLPGVPWRTTVAQQQALLRLIAVSSEEQIPPAALLEAWSEDETGLQRMRLQRLVKLLHEDRTLPAAVEATPGLLRDEDALALRFDTQSGTRTAAIRANLAETGEADDEPRTQLQRVRGYFAVVLPVSVLLFLFVQLKILPVLEKMFMHFGLTKPWSAGPSLNAFGPPSGLLQGGVLALFLFSLWLFATRRGQRLRRSLAPRFFRALHEQRAAEVLQHLSVAVTAGRPLPGALSTLARYHFDPLIRHDLLTVRNDVEQGTPIWESMTGAGLLTAPEARVLILSESQLSRAWALQQLAEAKRRRVARSRARTGEFLMPVCVLLLAALVVFQAVSVFVPLVALMKGLS